MNQLRRIREKAGLPADFRHLYGLRYALVRLEIQGRKVRER
jgi:hypothetical protein